MTDKRRQGIITLDEAQERFNDYYNKRNPSNIGILRGKLFDATYQKKPKYVLKPGEPGSEKYMLEEGPRTFDMVGVDYFPEGESFEVSVGNKKIRGVSKGATYYKDNDGTPSRLRSPDEQGRRKGRFIYGPRTKKDELYSKYFKKQMNERLKEFGDLGAAEKNLVDIYWENFKKKKYERKNKKDVNQYASDSDDLFKFDTSEDEELDIKYRNKYAVNYGKNSLILELTLEDKSVNIEKIK